MKKTISILMILLLLAVACIGFVACDEDELTPSGGDNPPVDKIGLHDFMAETAFSFGEFEHCYMYDTIYRATFGKRYTEEASVQSSGGIRTNALLLTEDTAFDGFVVGAQAIYDKYQEAQSTTTGSMMDNEIFSQIYSSSQMSVNDYIERKAGAFVGMHSIAFVERIDNIAVGNSLGEYIVLKKSQKEEINYVCVYSVKLTHANMWSLDFADIEDHFEHVLIEYAIIAYDSNSTVYAKIGVNLEVIVYADEIRKLFEEEDDELAEGRAQAMMSDFAERFAKSMESASPDELMESAEGYFAVMEEVIDAWMADPRGQAHINYIYG